MTDNLRVLHVMWQMGIGGAERAVFQLVREQRVRGQEADIVVATEMGTYGERSQQSGAAVFELGARGAMDVTRQWRIARLARAYSVVHVHVPEPALIAAVATNRGRTRLIYTHRGGVRSYGPAKRLRHATMKPVLRRRFHAISANTEQSARAVAGLLGLDMAAVTVLYNGLDFDLLEPHRAPADVMRDLGIIPGDRVLVGTAANLQEWKRVDRLLRAVALLDDRVHCLVLGDGPARSSLQDLARALHIDRRVTFAGRVEHVGDYLQLLDVFILPSGPEEAFGNAAVEAMGVGIPTVVFADGGGLVEHIRDRETGLIIQNVDGLAGALKELDADASLRGRLAEAGRDHVRTVYSLDAMWERYARLYDRVLAS